MHKLAHAPHALACVAHVQIQKLTFASHKPMGVNVWCTRKISVHECANAPQNPNKSNKLQIMFYFMAISCNYLSGCLVYMGI